MILHITDIKQTTEVQVVNNDMNDIKEDKITSVLKILLDKAKVLISKMEFYAMKTAFAEIFRFLRYLIVLSEHFTITVIEKCCSEIQSLLHVICDHCMWMICNGMLLDTVPLNYNFIFTHVNTCGNITRVREISSRVHVDHISQSVEYTHLVLYYTCCTCGTFMRFMCMDTSNCALWLYCYFTCVYRLIITQYVCWVSVKY